jgi:MerR family transcriptional regulator, light-induced transcriptional regulator
MAFTIKELESLSGVKAHTIRIWEQRYNFLRPARTQTNIRTYNNDELKTLLTVALLNKYGYKISRIDEMHPEQRVSAVLQLPQPEAYNENIINELLGYMVDLKNIAFEDTLNQYIGSQGVEKTISTIIFGFLEKVGVLWQTNKIVPVQEHIVSNIIRQKIVSAIDRLPFVRKQKPLFVLLLPENEYHELGLLFVYYLLRKYEIPVIYLGANVPLKDVLYLIKLKEPHCLYLHLTSLPRQLSFQKYLSALSSQMQKGHVLLSGSGVQTPRFATPGNVTIFHSFNETVLYLTSLDNFV